VTLARFLLWLLASATGVIIGFGIAFAVAAVATIVVPHCGIPCDDSGPEFVVAASAYGTWLFTAGLISVLAWRSIANR
jgi:hypothetical protein